MQNNSNNNNKSNNDCENLAMKGTHDLINSQTIWEKVGSNLTS